MSNLVLIAAVPVLVLAVFAFTVVLKVMWIQTRSGREARCIRCGSRDVRPSWTVSLIDRIYMVFSCSPYRCRSCRARFYRREPTPVAPVDSV